MPECPASEVTPALRAPQSVFNRHIDYPPHIVAHLHRLDAIARRHRAAVEARRAAREAAERGANASEREGHP